MTGEDRHREGGKVTGFLSLEEEGKWLRGALTSKLKEEFLWKFHGEDMQNDCVGKLILSNMGDRMVLIRSETEKTTEEDIGEARDWAVSWMEWWSPWRSTYVNQRRLVWTRWLRLPLQAWTRRFFNWACSKVGRVVEVRESTELWRNLDMAYVTTLESLRV